MIEDTFLEFNDKFEAFSSEQGFPNLSPTKLLTISDRFCGPHLKGVRDTCGRGQYVQPP